MSISFSIQNCRVLRLTVSCWNRNAESEHDSMNPTLYGVSLLLKLKCGALDCRAIFKSYCLEERSYHHVN